MHAGKGTADGPCDVIVAWSHISGKETENIVGNTVAELLLELHSGCNLVKRHVPRLPSIMTCTTGLQGAFSQLTSNNQTL